MGRWEGTVTILGKKLNVYVNFIHKPGELGSWNGGGMLRGMDILDTGAYETEIGNIVVTELNIGASGNNFSFKGSGKPKGPLAEYMKLS